MTIYEQIKNVIEGKNGKELSSQYIKSRVQSKFGTDPASVIPSDFCYNRTNKGIVFGLDNRLFEYLGKHNYKYLGENFRYTGTIREKPLGEKERDAGEWRKNGTIKWYNK